ncbi:response regulator [Crocinitomix algicola]|uniref:response regulator n=1 Tax=Crocinitomix algicola TaxID=1740263 RepID=UPI0008302CAD|nr:response regulator [Crocinitomix algicola]
MKNHKVYIIEDNFFYGSIIKSRIENLGYLDVELFTTGEAFMENIHDQPSVVFIDHVLPDYEGLTILKEIKSTYPQIQCIMLSGQEEIKVAIDSLKFGATDYLVKNADDGALRINEVIRDCIKINELQSQPKKKRKRLGILPSFL